MGFAKIDTSGTVHFRVYRETLQHFESKERLGKNRVLCHRVLQMVNWNHLLYIIKWCYDHLDAKNK